jgi:hypothetical protein
MPMIVVAGDTPNYVLMDGTRRIGPHVVQLHSGINCSPIYGFSTKAAYDRFSTNSELALKPYPLVKDYLRMRVGASDNDLKLVVLDAAGPREPRLRAATMEAVLRAQETCTTQVTAEYQLMFDQESRDYRVEK